jgi:hypothetical protein
MDKKMSLHTLHSHGGSVRDVSGGLREQGDLGTGRPLELQGGGRGGRRRSVELLSLRELRRVVPIGQGRSRNRVSSSLNDRSDSLVLQRGGRVGEVRRVTAILAGGGRLVGQTRGTANVGRPIEQNEVLVRGWVGIGMGGIGTRWERLRRVCRQAQGTGGKPSWWRIRGEEWELLRRYVGGWGTEAGARS